MKSTLRTSATCILAFTLLILSGCGKKIERKGVVVDELTNEPLEGVTIDIYMKSQKRDSLKEKVYTDNNGYFFMDEKRSTGQSFLIYKEGYIGHVSSLTVENDTIRLEKE